MFWKCHPRIGAGMTGRKLFAGMAVMALIFAACGGSDTTASTDVVVTSVAPTTTVPPTTTTTVPPTTTTTLSQEELDAVLLEEDTATIKSFWREYSDAWFGGVESGVAFASVHNHPLLGECPPEQVAEFWSYPEGWIEEVIVASVELARDGQSHLAATRAQSKSQGDGFTS